jgi:hypothetical protein
MTVSHHQRPKINVATVTTISTTMIKAAHTPAAVATNRPPRFEPPRLDLIASATPTATMASTSSSGMFQLSRIVEQMAQSPWPRRDNPEHFNT